MAQWNRAERTLYAKLVYYGPALGGKTTNLRVLHGLTDPDGKERLVSVETADDRTLFFDLLPFELGSVLGYRVAVKLYTVPGQVRYDTTRRLVLAGADAVVFVADSNPSRERENRAAWDDLRRNMRANGLDRQTTPVLVQLNKRDLAGAAAPTAMAGWFGVDPNDVRTATAVQGPGVLETFVPACRAMIERIVALAEPATRRTLDAGDLGMQIDRAFAPLMARLPRPAPTAAAPVVLEGADLLENALEAGLALGGQLADEHGRASRLAREADALRAVSDVVRSTGASFDRNVVVDAALTAAMDTLDAAAAALVVVASGTARIQANVGRPLDDLVSSPAGAALVARMASSAASAVAENLPAECPAAAQAAPGLLAIAVVPVEASPRTGLLVAMPAPERTVHPEDVRFLATLAAHLGVGLDKVRTHAELRRHHDLLEQAVRERTAELRKAYDELRSVDAMKDRFLSNVSHEMRSPLTAVIGAASFLRDYDGRPEQRREMADAVLHAASTLKDLLDGLLRVAGLETGAAVAAAPVPPAELCAEALRIACAEGRVAVVLDPSIGSISADRRLIARAVANLIDNAIKFGPSQGPIELKVGPCMLARSGAAERGVAISVLDRGPGILDAEAERIFVAFEQGGDPLTAKPGGVGLGLYEARGIARRHGGTVIHIPRAGGGSEFRLSLPAEPARSDEGRRAAGA
ncbi:MAG TPA: ATP-binding protein [Candidatus Polarisedimenticolaceae bacterium]|nr:ATP-binding protein [Candidatus Polarisedimenticolaceae bacterium]